MHDIHSSTDEYADRFSGPIGQFFNQVEIGAVLKLLREYPGGSVLDVGGGHARTAVPLVKQGYCVTVTGSDDSCRQRLDRYLPAGEFNFVGCNPVNLPFADNSFDVVVCTRIMAHEENWELLVQQMCRVAREAVLFDFAPVCSFNFFSGLLFRYKLKIERTTRPFQLHRLKALDRALASNEFVRECVFPQFLLPMVLHRKYAKARVSRIAERIFSAVGLTMIFGSPVMLLAKSAKPNGVSAKTINFKKQANKSVGVLTPTRTTTGSTIQRVPSNTMKKML